MTQNARRAHVVTGGFPPGSSAGHDHDYARLRLLGLLAEREVPASVANDFADIEKWLPVSQLLITYVAGPYPDTAQSRAIQSWLQAGGHWLGLHGTSGGRAERVEGLRQRRTVKTEHHAVLGSMFLTHPPICRIRVDVTEHALTAGVGGSFEVDDEPYFIELQDSGSIHVLLTADYGAAGAWPVVGQLYPADTSLQADGKTRVLGYTRQVGSGAVTYFALGHCHNPASRPGLATDATPLVFHGAWESDAFMTLLRNAIGYGLPAELRPDNPGVRRPYWKAQNGHADRCDVRNIIVSDRHRKPGGRLRSGSRSQAGDGFVWNGSCGTRGGLPPRECRARNLRSAEKRAGISLVT